ncbi:Hypothetical predicted protein [Pelobates cultripes]|uniref:Uncharacterized protein n=1 Tax=Pelobates cultripes TaxID=61616 RepID=A0AAD1S232_PELCU|nr:Hypothetical predicted protein [Pelobates cultripes]
MSERWKDEEEEDVIMRASVTSSPSPRLPWQGARIEESVVRQVNENPVFGTFVILVRTKTPQHC